MIVAIPAETPFTVPESDPTLTLDEVLLHTPPLIQSVTVVTPPIQTEGSARGHGAVVTVMIDEVKQPVGYVYVIAAVPPATPHTLPLAEPMVAIATAPLVHVPPVVASDSVRQEPMQTLAGPVIAGGVGLIEIVAVPVIVREQPVIAFVATTV